MYDSLPYAQGSYPPPAPLSPPPPPPVAPQKKHRVRKLLLVTLPLAILSVILFSTLGGKSATSTPAVNFNNTDTLANALRLKVQQRLDDPAGEFYAPGEKVTDVSCIHKSGREFVCLLKFSTGEGDNQTDTVTVAADGQSYITD